jgi:hypothetical protein
LKITNKNYIYLTSGNVEKSIQHAKQRRKREKNK